MALLCPPRFCSTGDPDYHDFLFNNITFPPPQGPLLARYRSQYNIRFGGM